MAKDNASQVWFNHFFQYGKSPKSENPLTLGFRLIGNPEEKEKRQKITLQVPLKVTSKPLQEEEAEQLRSSIISIPEFANFPIREKDNPTGNSTYKVLEIEVPNKRSILKLLPEEFQTGDYDKRFRFGFFPEQKFKSLDLAQRVIQGHEQDYEPDFLSEDEFRRLPYVIIDIEKPLWKKEDEKTWLKRRKILLKSIKKEKSQERIERINSLIGRLEDKLTTNIEGVGEAKLFDDSLRADISFVTPIWVDDAGDVEKEIYILDPRGECLIDEYNGYKLRKFRTERDLVSSLTSKFHEKSPVISVGHNQVYDYTQLRFAADSHKDIFDPSVEGHEPKRDFVRSFTQRLREDLVYLDTMWFSSICFPFLRQKRHGDSLRLESVANFLGIEFKKSLTHEQLREVEARRLAGQTEEIRKKALEEMLIYSSTDVEVTAQIKDKLPFAQILTQLKRVFPFSTYSKLAFSPNSAAEQNEYAYFRKRGCLPYTGFFSKERLDETTFSSDLTKKWKKEQLSSNKIFRARRGKYENVAELYLPLEDWMFRFAVMITGRNLAESYVELSKDPVQKMAILQYVKSVLKSPFTDYFITRRYEQNALQSADKLESKCGVSDEVTSRLTASYRKIERGISSLLPDIKGEKRKLIEPISGPVQETLFALRQDRDLDCLCSQLATLYLIDRNRDALREDLVPAKKADLTKIVNGFREFSEIARVANLELNKAYFISQTHLAERAKARFFARYGFSYEDFQNHLNSYYPALKEDLTRSGAEFLEAKEDYIYVRCKSKDAEKPRLTMKVRFFDTYEVG